MWVTGRSTVVLLAGPLRSRPSSALACMSRGDFTIVTEVRNVCMGLALQAAVVAAQLVLNGFCGSERMPGFWGKSGLLLWLFGRPGGCQVSKFLQTEVLHLQK